MEYDPYWINSNDDEYYSTFRRNTQCAANCYQDPSCNTGNAVYPQTSFHHCNYSECLSCLNSKQETFGMNGPNSSYQIHRSHFNPFMHTEIDMHQPCYSFYESTNNLPGVNRSCCSDVNHYRRKKMQPKSCLIKPITKSNYVKPYIKKKKKTNNEEKKSILPECSPSPDAKDEKFVNDFIGNVSNYDIPKKDRDGNMQNEQQVRNKFDFDKTIYFSQTEYESSTVASDMTKNDLKELKKSDDTFALAVPQQPYNVQNSLDNVNTNKNLHSEMDKINLETQILPNDSSIQTNNGSFADTSDIIPKNIEPDEQTHKETTKKNTTAKNEDFNSGKKDEMNIENQKSVLQNDILNFSCSALTENTREEQSCLNPEIEETDVSTGSNAEDVETYVFQPIFEGKDENGQDVIVLLATSDIQEGISKENSVSIESKDMQSVHDTNALTDNATLIDKNCLDMSTTASQIQQCDNEVVYFADINEYAAEEIVNTSQKKRCGSKRNKINLNSSKKHCKGIKGEQLQMDEIVEGNSVKVVSGNEDSRSSASDTDMKSDTSDFKIRDGDFNFQSKQKINNNNFQWKYSNSLINLEHDYFENFMKSIRNENKNLKDQELWDVLKIILNEIGGGVMKTIYRTFHTLIKTSKQRSKKIPRPNLKRKKLLKVKMMAKNGKL